MSAVVVFGATGTIGSALSNRLTADHRKLLLVGRNPDKVNALAHTLNQPGLTLDLTDSQVAIDALAKFTAEHGPIGAIVNCIGSVLLKSAHATSDREFRETLETNLFTSFVAVKAAGQLLRDTGGSVLLFASAAAEIGIQNHEAIAAAKAGVIGLMRSAAATYAPNNIRVNAISPGLVRSEMTRRIWSNPNSAAASEMLHPLRRLGDPEQVASAAAWFLDPANDWVTGQALGVDGGLGHVLSRR